MDDDQDETQNEATEIEPYQRVLDFARDVLAGKISRREAVSAGEVLFAALDRRDGRERAMREIVLRVAALEPLAAVPAEIVEQARALQLR